MIVSLYKPPKFINHKDDIFISKALNRSITGIVKRYGLKEDIIFTVDSESYQSIKIINKVKSIDSRYHVHLVGIRDKNGRQCIDLDCCESVTNLFEDIEKYKLDISDIIISFKNIKLPKDRKGIVIDYKKLDILTYLDVGYIDMLPKLISPNDGIAIPVSTKVDENGYGILLSKFANEIDNRSDNQITEYLGDLTYRKGIKSFFLGSYNSARLLSFPISKGKRISKRQIVKSAYYLNGIIDEVSIEKVFLILPENTSKKILLKLHHMLDMRFIILLE